MAHIHTGKNQHDLSVTVYIVRIDGDKPKALLHMHRKLGKLLPVGGHVELHETPWQATAHELLEESGYALSQLSILQPRSRIKRMSDAVQHPYPISMHTHYNPTDHFHTDISYAFIATSDPAMQISDNESADLRWLDSAELEALPSDIIFDNTREVYRFIFDEALKHWERVSTDSFLLDFPDEYRV
jgi:8-oxo-dGTP diphosphatase